MLHDYIDSEDLGFCRVSLRKDELIEIRFNYDTPYEIDAAAMVAIGRSIDKKYREKKRGIIAIPGLYGTMTKEARKIDMFKNAHMTLGVAVVIPGLAQRLLASFYFKMKPPPYPNKNFRLEKDAIEWLLEIQKKKGSNASQLTLV